jgi:hypothetical protein
MFSVARIAQFPRMGVVAVVVAAATWALPDVAMARMAPMPGMAAPAPSPPAPQAQKPPASDSSDMSTMPGMRSRSVFNGREPDQHRWDFDPLRLDSYSGRISFNPSPDWAFQVSYGFIRSPEQLTPNVNQDRITASATYNRPLAHGNWQTSFAWGRNYDHPGATLDGFLLESAMSLGSSTLFGRAEDVQKDELFDPPSPLSGHVFRVSELTLGYVYDLPVAKHLALGFGVQGTLDIVPSAIKFAYGGDPTS